MTAPDFPEASSPGDAYSPEAVVTALFEGLLGRSPDEEAVRHHVGIVRASGLAHLVRELARSPEALAQLGVPAPAGQADSAPAQEARPEPKDEPAEKDELVESYLAAWD